MIVAVDRIRAEQSSEHEDFRAEKDPHAELGGSELLLGRVEMVGQMGIVARGVAVSVAVN
jgi:hypothetical protein